MTSKFFTWTKGDRRNAAEANHRTGGLLPIVTDFSDTADQAYLTTSAKNAQRPDHRPRPPNLSLVPNHDAYGACLAPASALHNAALNSVSSASNLLAVVNDMLRSPALAGSVCPRSPLHKPLPGRPRSFSLPHTPEIAELPGSILLENQGFPPASPVALSATSQNQTMRSARSGNTSILSPTSAGPRASPREPPNGPSQHKKSLSENRTKSRPNLNSPSSTESKLTSCSVSTNGGEASSNDSARARAGSDSSRSLQPSPLILERKNWRKTSTEASKRRSELTGGTSSVPKQLEELKATITAQDHTISTLSAQFANLRSSHEEHVASLTEAHAKEVATLKTYTKALEEQQSQRTLHHTSSNHLLFLLDTTEPQSPTKDQPSPQQQTAGPSATSIRSFQTALEEQQPPSQSPNLGSLDMQALKRRLSTARKPDVGPVDLVRDRDQYKQTNEALKSQIESLMNKLNQSKKSEKALQNSVENLEARLMLSNEEKLEALEKIHNLDLQIDSLPTPYRRQFREGETFGSRPSHSDADQLTAKLKDAESRNKVLEARLQAANDESRTTSTIATFITHIERLQDQIKEKDARINDLEQDNELCRLDRDDFEHKYNEVVSINNRLQLQDDIQSKLSERTKEADAQIAALKSDNAESVKTIRRLQKSLDHYTILLEAHIRRQAIISIFSGWQKDFSPEQLASKDDIDKMIAGLKKRLRAHIAVDAKARPSEESSDVDARIGQLKKEIDFYVREIIFYRLDIRGYKKDIRDLKSAIGNTSVQNLANEANSPSPSICHRCSSGTPVRARFATALPGLGISASSSPTSIPMSASNSLQPSTPATSAAPSTPNPSPSRRTAKPMGTHKKLPKAPSPISPIAPQTPPRNPRRNRANEADNISPGISPKSVSGLSPSRTKPTPPSPNADEMGDMNTNFPLSTPALPQRVDTQRSMSDSIITMYASARTPDWSPPQSSAGTSNCVASPYASRERSGSLPPPTKTLGKVTPDRPARPRVGLFESPPKTSPKRETVKMDVMAEAERHSPHRVQAQTQASSPGHARSLSYSTTQNLTPPRKGSGGSSSGLENASSIPFVIAMGSPHNPALVNSHSNSAFSAPNNTGNRGGVGGTMASCSGSGSVNASFHGKLHSRNFSANSNASGIPLPGGLIKGKGKARKEIISSPALFGPAFRFGGSVGDDTGAGAGAGAGDERF